MCFIYRPSISKSVRMRLSFCVVFRDKDSEPLSTESEMGWLEEQLDLEYIFIVGCGGRWKALLSVCDFICLVEQVAREEEETEEKQSTKDDGGLLTFREGVSAESVLLVLRETSDDFLHGEECALGRLTSLRMLDTERPGDWRRRRWTRYCQIRTTQR